MAWIATAVVGSAVVGGLINANAAQSAANTQAGAIQSGQQLTANEFNTVTQQEQPFLQGGYGALNQLDYLMGIPNNSQGTQGNQGQAGYNGSGTGFPGSGMNGVYGPVNARATVGQGQPTQAPGQPPAGQSFPGGYGSLNAPFTADMMKQYSPAYQFQLQQGGQGVLNGASANQGAESGAAMKDLIGYNQNLANTAFNNAFNQYNTQQSNTYNRLAGLTQIGSSAAANLGAQGTQLAGNQASLAASQGAAQAAGQIGVANAVSGAVNTASMVPWLTSLNSPSTLTPSAGGYPG
jgi:hypothetical protein